MEKNYKHQTIEQAWGRLGSWRSEEVFANIDRGGQGRVQKEGGI